MKNKYLLLITLVISLAITACNNDETCRQIRYAGVNIRFFNDTINTKTEDTVEVAASFSSVLAHGIKSDLIDVDSIIKSSGTGIQLPLNQLTPVSKFAFKLNTNIYDTLTIYYTNKYQYLSLECGTMRVHHLDSTLISKKYFYKVKIENPEVNVTTTSSNVKNISIHHFVH